MPPSETVDGVDEHKDHLTRHYGHLAGQNDARIRDHDYLSQIRVIQTNGDKDILSVPVPMTIKSQIGNPVCNSPGNRNLADLNRQPWRSEHLQQH
jgi:hypothetical protein